MTPLASSLAALVPSEMEARLAKSCATDPSRLRQAVDALAVLAARNGGPPEAEEQQESKSVVGWLSALVEAFTARASAGKDPDKALRDLLGDHAGPMLAALSRELEFDVGSLAAGLAPEFARTLRSAPAESVPHEPQNGLAARAWEAASAAAAAGCPLTPTEREAVLVSPMAAYFLVAAASISGPKGSLAEITAAHRRGRELLARAEPSSLFGQVFGGSLIGSEAAELSHESEGEEALRETIRQATEAIRAKSPESLEDFRTLVIGVAEAVAEAAKELSFLGKGGARVSDKESEAIAEIRGAMQ